MLLFEVPQYSSILNFWSLYFKSNPKQALLRGKGIDMESDRSARMSTTISGSDKRDLKRRLFPDATWKKLNLLLHDQKLLPQFIFSQLLFFFFSLSISLTFNYLKHLLSFLFLSHYLFLLWLFFFPISDLSKPFLIDYLSICLSFYYLQHFSRSSSQSSVRGWRCSIKSYYDLYTTLFVWRPILGPLILVNVTTC